ncbi:Rhodopsin-like 7 [Homarus americanus]|uniref:Rhodopsin-like 7 n=1 Tax=Homarus americanus TaxID=6706 RepID=A0A8J5MZH0_HOMAM|nr:Rhodopsin-like 7 [Homarus americanus]
MGVKSLRVKKQRRPSNECRLAKVALTTVSLWFIADPIPSSTAGMTSFSVSPSLNHLGIRSAKANAVYNPIVYAISHPK